MALLLRTVLRHRTVGLPLLSNVSMRPLSISKVIFASEAREQKPSSITRSTASDNSDVSTEVRPIGERIKETTKTTGYVGVIVIGAVIICVLGSAIGFELWSKSSANGVYTQALAQCIDDPRVQDALGTPIKGFGEETRRRRRNHVAHLLIDRNGQTYMQMHFYIQGTRNKATVQLEKRIVSELCSVSIEFIHLHSSIYSPTANIDI